MSRSPKTLHLRRNSDRFMPVTQAASGNNRENNIRNFIRQDVLSNVDVHRERKNQSLTLDRVRIPSG